MNRHRNVNYSVVSGSPSNVRCLTYTIIIFNVILAVMGATMVALGFWLTLDSDFKRWVVDLEMEHFWIGVYILMAAGGLVMLQAFFGVCGAYQRKGRMLLMFVVLLVVCLILEVVGAAFMLSNGTRHSNIEAWLTQRFLYLMSVYNKDESSARIMNIIQEWVGCCGAYGVLDWVKWNKVIPTTCYNPITGNAWYMSGYGYMGCVRGFTMYLEDKVARIAGVSLILAFCQICALIAASCLIFVKRDYQKSINHVNRRY